MRITYFLFLVSETGNLSNSINMVISVINDDCIDFIKLMFGECEKLNIL